MQIRLDAQVPALANAHAHNDYKHIHPLCDAMHCGFTSFEADIFLKRGRFIVAHISPLLKNKRTLEALYLKPLQDSIQKNGGLLYADYHTPVLLLIDIKTDAERTYAALKPLLEKYSAMLTRFENGAVKPGAVTVIITGNKPYKGISGKQTRYAFIDEPLTAIEKDQFNVSYSPLASMKYSGLLSWRGEGKIPAAEKEKLLHYTALAHAQGKKVRLWASPEKRAVWEALLDCGVDLINTDDLVGLKDFLNSRK